MKNLATLISFLCCFSLSVAAQKYFDFENGTLPSEFVFSQNSKWRISNQSLEGSYSLCDSVAPQNSAVSENFSFTSPYSLAVTADTFSAVIKFTYGTGAINVASTNRFFIFVGANLGAADSLAFSNEKLKSFVLSFNGTSGDDTLRLFYLQNKRLTPIISTNQKCNGAKLAVRLLRSEQGELSLQVGADGTFDNLQTYAASGATYSFDGIHVGAHLLTSTANNRKWLQLDNIAATFAFLPLQATSLQRVGARSLQLTLNKSVDAISASDVSNYNLQRTSDGKNLLIDSVKIISENEILLFVNEDFSSNNYTLQIANLLDIHGFENNLVHDFSLEVLRYGDIVFSELMVRPNNESELPEEYIEIYNRTDSDVALSGFAIASPARTGRITEGVVKARSYAIIGAVPNVENDISVTSRPTLTDGGMALTLRDSYGIPLCMLAYSDTWYADELKKEGGYSLEKVDINNLEESENNWRAALDERGGTPNESNSVAANNPDITSPRCVGFSVSNNYIKLDFSEALSPLEISIINCKLNSYDEILKPSFTIENPTSLTLSLPFPLEKHKVYTLYSDNLACDFAENCLQNFELQLGFGDTPSAGEVVINELLFNPNAGGVDFVELYNRSEKIAQLQGSIIANRKVANGEIDRSYALPAYTLFPNEYVVLTTKPELVRAQYHCENSGAFISIPTMPPYANEAGCVSLLGIDSFYSNEKMHSGALLSKKGVSLERINPNRDANEESNWLSAAQTVGFATPTYKNSQHSAHEQSSSDGITLYPEVFSPDGDGVDDMLFIDYRMPSEGYVANISIFTSAGKIVKTLCRNATLAVEGRLSCDGVDNGGKRADVGVYVIFVEVFSLDGKVKQYKKTCVVGARF
ncbi:MAG: lamin tail domain-containing protein [Prevotellaceae bacterium]|nr:lamin tail domain-containing protein [Prevotellaceae bacterium]